MVYLYYYLDPILKIKYKMEYVQQKPYLQGLISTPSLCYILNTLY